MNDDFNDNLRKSNGLLAWASLVAQRVKRLPTMRETWVQSLGREDQLEKEMATHSSIHAWKIPWTEEPGGLQPTGSQRVGRDWATSLHFTSDMSQIGFQSLKATNNQKELPEESLSVDTKKYPSSHSLLRDGRCSKPTGLREIFNLLQQIRITK